MVAVAEVKGVMSHRLLCAAFIVLTACGGTANSSTALPEASAVTAERSCIELANVIREPRAGEPDSVHVKHVLVKHKDAKNPREGVTRSREEACERAIVARDKVIGGADFDQVVTEFSDEAGAATRAGELGVVRRSELQKPFADAAFALDLQQMSDVVETDFGFHLILRVP
jgi:hypothetical protein